MGCCNLLLWIAVILFMLVGAEILFVIETTPMTKQEVNEPEPVPVHFHHCKDLTEMLEEIWNDRNRYLKDDWKRETNKKLENFQDCKQVLQAKLKEKPKKQQRPPPLDEQITTFSEAFSCIFSVLTTIGWGNTVPNTTNGRIFVIVYAFVGIPLVVVLINDIVSKIKQILKFIFTKECNCHQRCHPGFAGRGGPCCPQCSERDSKACKTTYKCSIQNEEWEPPLFLATVVFLVYLFIGSAVIFKFQEPWTYMESVYYSFAAFSTIGFGDIAIIPTNYFLLYAVYILIGIALLAINFEVIQNSLTGSFESCFPGFRSIIHVSGCAH